MTTVTDVRDLWRAEDEARAVYLCDPTPANEAAAKAAMRATDEHYARVYPNG